MEDIPTVASILSTLEQLWNVIILLVGIELINEMIILASISLLAYFSREGAKIYFFNHSL